MNTMHTMHTFNSLKSDDFNRTRTSLLKEHIEVPIHYEHTNDRASVDSKHLIEND